MSKPEGSRDDQDHAAGGNTYKSPEDHGFMCGHGFQDPDGHIWELIHMDMAAFQKAPQGA